MGILDWLVSREPKDEDPYESYRRGRDAMDDGDWQAAIARLTQAGEGDASLIDAFHYRGVAYLMRGQFKRAMPLHRAAYEGLRNNGEADDRSVLMARADLGGIGGVDRQLYPDGAELLFQNAIHLLSLLFFP